MGLPLKAVSAGLAVAATLLAGAAAEAQLVSPTSCTAVPDETGGRYTTQTDYVEGAKARAAEARRYLDRALSIKAELVGGSGLTLAEGAIHEEGSGRLGEFYTQVQSALDCAETEEGLALMAEFREASAAKGRRIAADREAAANRQAALEAERARMAAAAPPLVLPEITRAVFQDALDRYLAEGMRLYMRATFGRAVMRVEGGRTYVLSLSMRYVVRSFAGCDVDGATAVCRATVSADIRDEINSGMPTLQGEMSGVMRGIGNAYLQEGGIALRYAEDAWHVSGDPGRLLQR